MANGLRLWCIDRNNGAIIHLGGEFTWGDCHAVGDIIHWLIETGHLPADGNYGEGVVATPTILTDGMPWIEDYVVAKFTAALVILDAYHAMERLMHYASVRFGKQSEAARRFYDNCLRLLFGTPLKKAPKKRKNNHQEARSNAEGKRNTFTVPPWLNTETSERGVKPVTVLLEQLSFEDIPNHDADTHEKLVSYIEHNAYRMDYTRYRRRGYQIGSGAMESLHRTGSQKRLKLPGAKWLPESSQAIFNVRMLYLCGRWDEFWKQKDLYPQLVRAFSPKPREDHLAQAEAA